eukprot:CAMPEP_0206412728 /NCGR_PEP_ID=MMETSP0294-20121207/34208_1 /ASSEMBLY_ACC=CAM_ASM_000327 /TAXON_ID=39354 /ORGANISM="Heterosigma akashiwo, Strain CCMP2393" /LENGTH=66 /DNA_ID=CAMNT_0053874015 /DNA_START=290 /DNA_END=487 /DNA_ORIENTATION=+
MARSLPVSPSQYKEWHPPGAPAALAGGGRGVDQGLLGGSELDKAARRNLFSSRETGLSQDSPEFRP